MNKILSTPPAAQQGEIFVTRRWRNNTRKASYSSDASGNGECCRSDFKAGFDRQVHALQNLQENHRANHFFESLNEYRCMKAAEYISDGKSVSKAASPCGFDNNSFFTKTFKRYIGALPSKIAPESCGAPKARSPLCCSQELDSENFRKPFTSSPTCAIIHKQRYLTKTRFGIYGF